MLRSVEASMQQEMQARHEQMPCGGRRRAGWEQPLLLLLDESRTSAMPNCLATSEGVLLQQYVSCPVCELRVLCIKAGGLAATQARWMGR